jgi:NAD(P)-dependent dehydrogenase (short-subunit alcohol dehydrogenase family)
VADEPGARREAAVVTGAGRGIGREIARRLAGRGYAVLVTDVDQSAAERTATELGGSAWSLPLDVRDPEAHRAAAASAAERGPLRVWVNNAGVLRTLKAWEHPDEEVRLMVEANLLGVVWGSRAAVDAMRSGTGQIINIASLSALGPVPGLSVYAGTKAGVLNFTTSLQGDLDEEGWDIRVHAVCPDTVGTDMVHERTADPDSAIIFSAPRILTAAEVADRAVALLDTSKVVLVVPRWRGWVARSLAPFPRAGLKILAAFRRSGERKRKKASESA